MTYTTMAGIAPKTLDSETIVRESSESLSIAEYASGLAKNGIRFIAGTEGSLWVKHESLALLRIPTFYLAPPPPDEIRRVLWRGWVPLISYLRSPDEHHSPNAWLYVCTDRAYALD